MFPARASMAWEKVKYFTAEGAGFHATYHKYEDSYATVSSRLRFLHVSVIVSTEYLSWKWEYQVPLSCDTYQSN